MPLDDYFIVVLDLSTDRNKCGEGPQVKVRGILSLRGKRTVGHYGFVGKIFKKASGSVASFIFFRKATKTSHNFR